MFVVHGSYVDAINDNVYFHYKNCHQLTKGIEIFLIYNIPILKFINNFNKYSYTSHIGQNGSLSPVMEFFINITFPKQLVADVWAFGLL